MATPHVIALYVDDEESDRFLMRRAFAKAGLEPALRLADHGREAIDYLSGTGAFAEREKYPVPGVVLLDLHLPEVNGFDVLKWIRSHPVYTRLPVVLFSSSAREDDRARAKLLEATEFMPKPSSAARFQDVVRMLNERWLSPNRVEV